MSEYPAPGYMFSGWIGTGDGSYSGNFSSPDITVDGPVNETAQFVPIYKITFLEKGLPQFSAFTVKLNGSSETSFGGNDTYYLPAGNYSYTIGNVIGYKASIKSGSLMVSNASETVTVHFTAIQYKVTLNENGLPAGKMWSVELPNGTTYFSSGTSIAFSLVDGFYSYNVSSNDEYVLSPAFTILDVHGGSLTANISFVSDPILQVQVLQQGSSLTVNGINVPVHNEIYDSYLYPGFYYVNVTSPGYLPYSNLVYLQPGEIYSYNVSLLKLAHYGFLDGSVSPGTATIMAGSTSVPVVNGHYNISLSPGTYFVSFSDHGYVSAIREVNITSGRAMNLNVTMEKAQVTSTLYGYLTPGSASIVVNGFVAYVNNTGFYHISLPDGYYQVSIYANGYFPESVNVSLFSTQYRNLTLEKEPEASSTTLTGNAEAQGFNVTLSNLRNGNGFISVDFSSGNNGSLVISFPYSELSNVTISEILNSTVFIGNQSYHDFIISISSNYSILLRVYGLEKGDPTLYWKYTPAAVIPSSPSHSQSSPLAYAIAITAAGIIASLSVITVRKTRKK